MTDTVRESGRQPAAFGGLRVPRGSHSDPLPPLSLSNWLEAPYNRWSFSHVDEMVPSTAISKDPRSTAQNHSAVPETSRLKPLVAGLQDRLVESCTDALLVLHHGEIVHEQYFGQNTPDSKHLLMSVSKSLCGLTIGQLVASGDIDTDMLVEHYVPALAQSAYGDATVQQVLDMTAAVTFSESYHDPNSHVQTQDRVAGWRPRREGDPEDNYEFLARLEKSGEHGHVFQYCSAGTDVLAWIAENVTGLRFAEVLSNELWSRIGADHDALITTDNGGFAFANGGIACTARDLARIGQLMLDGGALDGVQVVSSRWVADTASGGDRSAAAGTAFQRVHPNGSYRNQWWATGDDRGSFYASGIHGQFIWVDPVSSAVIVKFSSLPVAITEAVNREHAELFRAIAAGLDHF